MAVTLNTNATTFQPQALLDEPATAGRPATALQPQSVTTPSSTTTDAPDATVTRTSPAVEALQSQVAATDSQAASNARSSVSSGEGGIRIGVTARIEHATQTVGSASGAKT
jgi:hypothetical protein